MLVVFLNKSPCAESVTLAIYYITDSSHLFPLLKKTAIGFPSSALFTYCIMRVNFALKASEMPVCHLYIHVYREFSLLHRKIMTQIRQQIENEKEFFSSI